jgi:hypothetical protein
MQMGDFFKSRFGKNPTELTLKEIDKIVFKEHNAPFGSVQTTFVTMRGNIFPPKHYDIDSLVDASIKNG